MTSKNKSPPSYGKPKIFENAMEVFYMQNFENATPDKIQIYPAKKLVLAIDKLKKIIYDATDDSTERAILEDKKSQTITPLDIKFSAEFDGENLTAFDELVFDICVSEQAAGNEFTTLAIIHRAMGGSKTNFTPKEKNKILLSIRKLATTWIKFDCTNTFKKFGYNGGADFKYNGYLLPAEYVSKTIGGHTDDAIIHFLRRTPLLDVAKLKGQFVTCDAALLDVPNTKNTELVLTLKGYLLRRVLQIVGSYDSHKKHFRGKSKDGKNIYRKARELEKTILLDTLFAQCGLSDAPKNRKAEYRKTIEKIMNHFKAEKIISDWHFEKESGKFRAIKIEI